MVELVSNNLSGFVEITVATIGTIGVIMSALIYTKRSKHKLNQIENELTFQQKALDFGAFVEEWANTHEDIVYLLEHTQIDRFMMFRAWNGRLTPRWTTAVFQMRLGKQEPISYVHFELDTDYVSRLKEISIRNVSSFRVEDLPDCAIKRVYETEGVKHAIWCHIMSEDMGKDSVAHTYCSFATHEDQPVDVKLQTRCQILSGRLKGIAMSFNG